MTLLMANRDLQLGDQKVTFNYLGNVYIYIYDILLYYYIFIYITIYIDLYTYPEPSKGYVTWLLETGCFFSPSFWVSSAFFQLEGPG